MQNKPALSIIVPNYNHAAFLDERLNSVLNQTFQDFEIILLDDASTDDSLYILQKYSTHPKVSRFIRNDKNSGGPFNQWQRGFDLAKGDFIWIAESDDFCEENFIESLLPLLKKKTVLAYCASKMVTDDGSLLGLDPWSEGKINNRWTNSYHNSGKNEIEHYLRYRNTIPNASAVIFKKKAIENIRIPNQLTFCGDWYLWLEILKKGDIAFLNSPLNNFRTHDSSTRAIKDYRLEEKRMNEYLFNIVNTSTIKDRVKNSKNYSWIINEINRNKHRSSKFSIIRLHLPVDILIRYHKRFFKDRYSLLKHKLKTMFYGK